MKKNILCINAKMMSAQLNVLSKIVKGFVKVWITCTLLKKMLIIFVGKSVD